VTTKKPEEVNFTEIDIDTYQPDEIKKAEDIIRREVDKNPYIPVAKDKPEIDPKRLRKEKEDYIQNDPLLRMIQEGSTNSFGLLDKIMEEAAADHAALKFDREHNDSHLFDSTKVIKAHGTALKLLSDLILSKKDLAKDNTVNLKSKKLSAVFDYFFEVVQTSIAQTEGISPEQGQIFFSILHKNLENFEGEAERVMKKVEED